MSSITNSNNSHTPVKGIDEEKKIPLENKEETKSKNLFSQAFRNMLEKKFELDTDPIINASILPGNSFITKLFYTVCSLGICVGIRAYVLHKVKNALNKNGAPFNTQSINDQNLRIAEASKILRSSRMTKTLLPLMEREETKMAIRTKILEGKVKEADEQIKKLKSDPTAKNICEIWQKTIAYCEGFDLSFNSSQRLEKLRVTLHDLNFSPEKSAEINCIQTEVRTKVRELESEEQAKINRVKLNEDIRLAAEQYDKHGFENSSLEQKKLLVFHTNKLSDKEILVVDREIGDLNFKATENNDNEGYDQADYNEDYDQADYRDKALNKIRTSACFLKTLDRWYPANANSSVELQRLAKLQAALERIPHQKIKILYENTFKLVIEQYEVAKTGKLYQFPDDLRLLYEATPKQSLLVFQDLLQVLQVYTKKGNVKSALECLEEIQDKASSPTEKLTLKEYEETMKNDYPHWFS